MQPRLQYLSGWAIESSSPDSSIARLCNRVDQGNAVVETVAAHRDEISTLR